MWRTWGWGEQEILDMGHSLCIYKGYPIRCLNSEQTAMMCSLNKTCWYCHTGCLASARFFFMTRAMIVSSSAMALIRMYCSPAMWKATKRKGKDYEPRMLKLYRNCAMPKRAKYDVVGVVYCFMLLSSWVPIRSWSQAQWSPNIE